jgi:hypothetical protein
MSTLQEHCVDDVQEVRYVDTAGALCRRCTGGTVCRHCRSIVSTMYRMHGMSKMQEHIFDDVQDARYPENAGASILNSGHFIP